MRIDENKDQLLTLEHYSERYIPVKIQQMIIDNMKVIHDQDKVDLLKSEKNKLYSRIQSQILDDKDFTNGCVFDDIVKINNEMTKYLQVRIDLRTNNLLAPDVDILNSAEDRIKQQEERLENYILEFADLLRDNDKKMVLYEGQLDKMLQKRMDDLEIRLQLNVADMKKHALKDYDEKREYQREIE